MTDFTVKVRRDEGEAGSNKIEVFFDTDPKQEIMILTDRAEDREDEEASQDTALYYAVERIAQLEKERDEMAEQLDKRIYEKTPSNDAVRAAAGNLLNVLPSGWHARQFHAYPEMQILRKALENDDD